jgi:hypothetical protein
VATNVGSIDATLTLDRDPFSRELRAAKAEAEAFEHHRYTAHVDVDTDRAHRGLQQVDEDSKRTEKSLSNASRGGNLLVSSLIALGPAAVPLAAVASTLGVGLVAAAGVGVLAILGVKHALEDGGKLGQAFNTQLKIAQTDLRALETIAARGIFGGLQTAVGALHTSMPLLRQDVTGLSVQLGLMGGNVVTGLVALFHQLNPLFSQFGDMLVGGSAKFAAWAQSGKGVQGFLAYARDALPQVVHTIGELATAFGHIVQAAAPLGGVTLQAISGIATAISHIPIPVLTAFIAALQVNRLLSMAGGVGGLASAFGKLSSALGTGLMTLGGFIQGTLAMGPQLALIAAGIVAIGVAAAALSGKIPGIEGFRGYIGNLDKAGKDAAKSWHETANVFGSDVKDAFTTGGAAAQEMATKVVIASRNLGPIDTILRSAGKSQDEYTLAITGTNTQFDKFVESVRSSPAFLEGTIRPEDLDKLRELRNQYTDGRTAGLKYRDAVEAVNKALAAPNLATYAGSLAYLGKQYGLTEAQATAYAQMVGITKQAVEDGAVTNKGLGDSIKLVRDAYSNANVTQNAFLDSLAKFSTTSGTAADRAALIGATLVASQGDALSFAASMNAGAVATKNLGDSVGHLAKGIVDLKTGEIDYNNAAAAPLIAGLQQMQSTAMQAAQAMFQHEVGTKGAGIAADEAYGAFHHLTYDALVGQATALGITTEQAKLLAEQYFGMPKDVKTKIEQIGADPVLSVLKEIRNWLHMIVDPSWKPEVGLIDHATIPLSAIDQHLTATGAKRPHPDVALIDHVSVPLSAVDRHLGLTGSKRPRPEAALVDNASGPLSSLDQRLGLVGGRRPTPTANLNNQASGPLSSIDAQLSALDGRVATTTVRQVTEFISINTSMPLGGRPSATGNIFKYYATGGQDVPNRHQPQIAPKGTYRVWAEPETEGEAYIPYRRDTRARSEAILAQVANDFGLRVSRAVDRYATGGTTAGPAAVAGTDAGMWPVMIAALHALLAEMRALRANSDPWKTGQIARMYERAR